MRHLLALIGVFAAIGCTTQYKPVMADDQTAALGQADSYSQDCANRGLLPRHFLDELKAEIRALFSITAYSHETYLAAFNAAGAEVRNSSVEDTRKMCAELGAIMPTFLAKVREDRARRVASINQRSAQVAAIFSTLETSTATFRQSAEAYTATAATTLPQGRAQPPAPKDDTVTIYRDGEFTTCTTASTGVVVCQ